MISIINCTCFYRHGKYLAIRLIIALLLLSHSTLSAQRVREEPPPLGQRLFWGGSFSLQLGTISNIEISPVAGIWLLPRIAVAAGPSYQFYKFGSEKTDIFGGRSYVQLVFLRDIDKFIPLGIHTSLFLHLEDEVLLLDSEYWKNVTYPPDRFAVNTILAGVGMSQQIGRRSSINFMLLWALNESDYDLYSNPEIRIGFVF